MSKGGLTPCGKSILESKPILEVKILGRVLAVPFSSHVAATPYE